eukprot:SAG22_NODE_1138_length_5389_cov_22.995085_7_plen_219_part_00
MTGAAMGRLFGEVVVLLVGEGHSDPGLFSLCGAAAMLGASCVCGTARKGTVFLRQKDSGSTTERQCLSPQSRPPCSVRPASVEPQGKARSFLDRNTVEARQKHSALVLSRGRHTRSVLRCAVRPCVRPWCWWLGRRAESDWQTAAVFRPRCLPFLAVARCPAPHIVRCCCACFLCRLFSAAFPCGPATVPPPPLPPYGWLTERTNTCCHLIIIPYQAG